MKIAMISEHASPLAAVGDVDAGGQNVHVAALASALAARGHRVDVYTRRDRSDQPLSAVLREGVRVHHVDAGPATYVAKDQLLPYMPSFAARMRDVLAAAQPTLLHGHFWMSGMVCAQVAQFVDVPTVQTFHALGCVKRRIQGCADTSPRPRLAIERQVARQVDRIIASCADEKRELAQMGVETDRVDIVPSGVDCTWFVPDGARAPRARLKRLLVVGRLVPRKGVDDAVAALQWVEDAELVIAGGPEASHLSTDAEAKRLQMLARDLGLAHRVHLLGQVPHSELPPLVRSADLVVCLPWYEPFGIVPLEAMACGIPVVGSAVGGLLDTVIDGVTGVLLPPRQPLVAAEAINRLLADSSLRSSYGQAGRARALKYTWARVAAATERSYVRAIARRRTKDAYPSTEQSGSLA